jgi:transcriptional regulator with XRE-family HTH domain
MNGLDLKLKRIALGLGQTELAKLLGVYQRTISEWESGRVVIRHPVILDRALRNIASELGVEPRDLLKDPNDG